MEFKVLSWGSRGLYCNLREAGDSIALRGVDSMLFMTNVLYKTRLVLDIERETTALMLLSKRSKNLGSR